MTATIGMKAKGKRKKKKREAKNGSCYRGDFKREVVVTGPGALATGSQTQLPQPISAAEAFGGMGRVLVSGR
jgi:hypothetical protein